MPGLDFDGLGCQLAGNAEALLASWLPGGRKRGGTWVCGDLSGAKGESLTVKLATGQWADWATGDHGTDLISLYAAIHDLTMGEAFRQLGGDELPTRVNGHARAPTPPPEPVRQVVTPVPEAVAEHACVHPVFGKPVMRWAYLDGNGDVLGYVARYEREGQRKQIVPWTYDGEEWGMGQWPEPRPLYGLQALAERPEAPVLIVEGEKAADAARKVCKPYAVVTWPGGARALEKADWRPVHGRQVLLWPDADKAGTDAMNVLAALLHPHCTTVKVLDVSGQPDGWDAADAEFASYADARAWMAPRARVWEPPTSVQQLPAPAATTTITDPETGEILPLAPEFSDDAMALEFVAVYGAGLRWTPGMGWMHDQQTHWVRDEHLIRYDLARKTARRVAQTADPKARKPITSAKTVNSILFLAQSDPDIVVPASQWDNDPLMLNTPAGLVDLKSGKVVERNREQYLTQITRISPDESVKIPNWERFVSQVFADKTDIIEFVQRMCGYCLSGDRREQKLFFAHGQGSNGKSTLLDIFMWMMGSYALKLPTAALMMSKNERHPTELAQLHGKRLAVSNELEEGAFWAEARIKELTGDETLTARFMRQDNFTFTMSHKHLIAGNHKPRLKGGDPAMARRMVLLPFEQKFEGEAKDPKLPEKLKAEAPGILAWAVRGAVKWFADGLAIPGKVEEASREYMADHDDIAMWMEECCERSSYARCRSSELYASFRRWKQQRGEHEPSQTVWTEKLAVNPGVSKIKSDGVMVWKGIDLSASEKARRDGL